jgi:hypothetical protein
VDLLYPASTDDRVVSEGWEAEGVTGPVILDEGGL